MQEIQGKHAELSIERPESLMTIARALSSQVRLDVMLALSKCSLNVGELAKLLDVPMSTMALAVRTLEEANLIMTDIQPGSHGASKICSRKLDSISISMVPSYMQDVPEPRTFQMPIGGYSIVEGIMPTCGLLSDTQALGPIDVPRAFYSPRRFEAQLLWFQQGFLEYRFSTMSDLSDMKVNWLELSFEACSEAPLYRDPWPSDISVEINHKRLGSWTSPSDCGGRQGHLTPEWWDPTNTQFGFLKTWRVDHTGTYLDHCQIGSTTISDLSLAGKDYISVRIGVDPASEHVNGINLFGEKFGDHPQAITLQMGFSY